MNNLVNKLLEEIKIEDEKVSSKNFDKNEVYQ
ncbi:hypothetical protein CY0110_25576 [Crocosphaera chwakensis CCY0110]|uniref:Uncharacterized protein n=1 Tax=Crocosphaera chwakensis CCY0110 TaxID=391612 RepID=A3IRL5_9CHRO|nr:hypothetical protein CY0110_25576 [Crocosphaera chwakensis CCY0110]